MSEEAVASRGWLAKDVAQDSVWEFWGPLRQFDLCQGGKAGSYNKSFPVIG